MMRRKRAIDAVLPPTRKAILTTLFLEPERSWYLSDLASHLKRRNPSSLQRELESLVSAEILIRRQEGNRVYFQANRDCPIYPDLCSLIAKTSGLVAVVQRSLLGLKNRIQLAYIYGSIAREQERATSDVDLMIIGDVGLAEVSLHLRSAEEQLQRSVNASVYTADEYAKKLSAGNHFLTAIARHEKLFVLGNEDELEKLAGGRKAPTPHYGQAGAG